MADKNNLTTLAKRLRPFMKIAAQDVVGISPGDHGLLSGLSGDDHSQYVHLSTARTITAQHQFAPGSAQAPFTLGANALGQLVTGLYADQLSKQIIAGAGLTGGGALTADRTLTVGAGAGITVNADDVALTTPGTLSVSSTNNATGNHTHAVTSSSNPGAAATLLASDASGHLRLVRLGAGVAPGYLLHAQGASEQLRLGYDASNYASFAVDSAGSLTITPVGDLYLDPTGNDVLPVNNYDINIGAPEKKILSLWAAELNVQTVVARDVISTIGGEIVVAPTSELTADLAAAATSMTIKHNMLLGGYIVRLEARSQVEFIQISDKDLVAASAVQDAFLVATNLTSIFTAGTKFYISGTPGGVNDGTWTVDHSTYSSPNTSIYVVEDVTSIEYTGGAIHWYAPDTDGPYTYWVTRNLEADPGGAEDWLAGDAVVDITYSFIDLYAIHGMKSGTEYGPTIVGNVRASATYNDWGPRWAVGNLNGLYGYATDLYGAAFGSYASAKANVTIDETNGFRLRSYTTTILQIKNSDGLGYIVGPLYLDTSGGIYQGTGTFASPTDGLKLYNSSGYGRLTMYDSGAVISDYSYDGLYFVCGNAYATNRGFRLKYDGTDFGFYHGYVGAAGSAEAIVQLKCYHATRPADIYVSAVTDSVSEAASANLTAATGLVSAAIIVSAGATGLVYSYNTVELGASLHVGSVGAAADDNDIWVDNDIRTAGGLHVGAIDTNPSAGVVTIETNDALTSTHARGLILQHNTSGTPAAGFGNQIHFQLESTTTEDRDAATIAAEWATATDATRKGALKLFARDDSASRLCLTCESSGSAAMIGFLGAAASVRLAHVANPTDLATALSAIASILTTLETFGFHETS